MSNCISIISHIVLVQVVPFTPSAGLLAWVEQTVPLNNYLVGEDRTSGAHVRYARKRDWSFVQCFLAVQKSASNKKPLRQRCGFLRLSSVS